MHWLDFEAAEVQRSFSRSPRSKFQNPLVFKTFHYRVFIIFVFDKISNGMLVTIEKELGKYFQWLHFWNQLVPLIKMQCRVRYLFDFDLKSCKTPKSWSLYLAQRSPQMSPLQCRSYPIFFGFLWCTKIEWAITHLTLFGETFSFKYRSLTWFDPLFIQVSLTCFSQNGSYLFSFKYRSLRIGSYLFSFKV